MTENKIIKMDIYDWCRTCKKRAKTRDNVTKALTCLNCVRETLSKKGHIKEKPVLWE